MTEFGILPGGATAQLLTLERGALRVRVTDFGARMVSIEAPDRDGASGNVLLGLDDAGAYASAGGSFGAVLGRCANRIGGARFVLGGRTYRLVANDGASTLHGGPDGFGMRLWSLREAVAADAAGNPSLLLGLRSLDGEGGFPGEVEATARYTLRADALRLDLSARADAPTIVNLSAHPYFNLGGDPRHDILAHELTVHAHRFLPTGSDQVPTGELRDVAGTPFDFRVATAFGERIFTADPQLMPGRGYDSCLVLDGEPGVLREAARVHDPRSGRTLEVWTTQPGLQVYSGNSLDGSVVGRGGVMLRQSSGFALEPENFPDAPNQPGFPSAVLRPGEVYAQTIEYRFGKQ